jgi:hypothetical protein
MWRVDERGPRDDGPGADPVLRAVLVVALVAAAALALQGRQGLDWDRLADPVQVRWARVLVGSVALFLLAAFVRRLLGRLRRPRLPARSSDDATAPAGEPFPLLLRALALLTVLVTLAVVWFVVDAVTGPLPPPVAEEGAGAAGDGDGSARPQVTWWHLAEVAAVLLVVATLARLARRRSARQAAEPPEGHRAPVAATLAAAVEAAEEELRSARDARGAIVAAYAAMATSISAGLARSGGAARPSDTPTELLDRAVGAGLVGAGPAAELTALFREARFSRHPMGEPQRRAAERALVAVHDELVARRG